MSVNEITTKKSINHIRKSAPNAYCDTKCWNKNIRFIIENRIIHLFLSQFLFDSRVKFRLIFITNDDVLQLRVFKVQSNMRCEFFFERYLYSCLYLENVMPLGKLELKQRETRAAVSYFLLINEILHTFKKTCLFPQSTHYF